MLNDNGRSYAPTVSHLSQSLTSLRLNPTYTQTRERLRLRLREIPAVGEFAYSGVRGLTSALARDRGPAHLLRGARRALRGPDRRPRHRADGAGVPPRRRVGRPDRRPRPDPEGPRLRAGRRGRDPAPARLQGATPVPVARPDAASTPRSTNSRAGPPAVAAFDVPRRSPTPTPSPARSCARPSCTPRSWPSPRPCRARRASCRSRRGSPTASSTWGSPSSTSSPPPPAWRWAACGRSSPSTPPSSPGPSTRPTSTSGSTDLPVVFVLDRAGITGDDGPSHHGVLDLVLTLSIPGMTVFAPSSAAEVEVMLEEALNLPGPASDPLLEDPAARGGTGRGRDRPARPLRAPRGRLGVPARRRQAARAPASDAADELAADGIEATVWDVRVVSPPDPAMLADAARAPPRGHRRGRPPPRRCGHVPARRPADARARRHGPNGRCSGIPALVHRPGSARRHPGLPRPRRDRDRPQRPRDARATRRGRAARSPDAGGSAQT